MCLKYVKEEVGMEPLLEDWSLWAQLDLTNTLPNVWEIQIHWAREREKLGQNSRKVYSQPSGIHISMPLVAIKVFYNKAVKAGGLW